MFMDSRQRGEIESSPDFFQARRVAVVLDELVQVVEDFTLPFREREHFIPPVRSRWRDYNANRRRRSSGLRQGRARSYTRKASLGEPYEASIVGGRRRPI